jgi:hypothetical protein
LVCDRNDNENEEGDEFKVKSLREIAQTQTVLVIFTSKSKRVPLDILALHALPLDQIDTEGLDIIRTSLFITIEYFVALEKEMEQPRSGRLPVYDNSRDVHTTPQSFDRIVNKLPETWSTAMMARAKQDGYDFMSYPKTERCGFPDNIEKAVMRIKAKATGEPCHSDLELDEWDRRWKPGYD